jgi:SNF2 family DNA or RNA helicase
MNKLPEMWAHQKQGVEKAKTVKNLAIFFEPGTGKSRTTIEILRDRCNENKRILKTLIVSPLIVTQNWKEEFRKFCPDGSLMPRKVKVLTGTIKEKAEYVSSARTDEILVCNYDVFVSPEFLKACIQWSPEVLVLDESHRVKNQSSKRTKAITKLSLAMAKNEVCHRYLLTGTPVTNDQLDLWSQFYVLDNGKTLGDSYFGFRAQYFWDLNASKKGSGKYFPMFVPKKNINDKLNSLILSSAVVAKKEDCLDLPDLVKQIVYTEMSPVQRKHYEAMKKDFLAFINEKAAVAQLAITKSLRMQQILSGFLKMDDDSIERFENPRAKVLSELLEEITSGGHKVIVWSVFRDDYATIREVCDTLKIKYLELTGETKNADKFKNMELFEKDESFKVLIGAPGAGGIGVNLVSAKYSIWYSRTFNLEQDLQAEARNYRGGSEIHDKVTRYDIVCKGTLDEVILKSLYAKNQIKDEILSLKETDI